MSMNRRTLLSLSAAGALGVGASLLGAGSALADTAPANPFAVGVRQYTWWRGSRQISTYVYYPATGAPGGNPVTNAPVANGVFPVCEYTHGSGASPQRALAHIRPLAAAGFIVPAPVFTNAGIGDAYNGNLSRDVSEVLTRTLALNTGGDPLAGHINAAVGVGVSGYSMGGMTTHGLLTAWPDSRIKAAVPISCVDMGNPTGSVSAKVLFIHGDRDQVCPLSSARQAYAELSSPKAFLTFVGADHGGTSWGTTSAVALRTWHDWMRWSLYGDTAARDRLPADASGSGAKWESALGDTPSGPGSYRLIAQHSGKYADIDALSTAAGAKLIQWASTGRTNQQFEFIDAGEGHVKIKARHSGLVLQIASNESGADITQQADTNAASQHWRVTDHGGGVVSLINRQSGLAMDVWERSTADGARISQWAYNGGTNQRFTRQAV
jgi:fermentation-respiration switch protein FrsA (DUF1100 family)